MNLPEPDDFFDRVVTQQFAAVLGQIAQPMRPYYAGADNPNPVRQDGPED